MQLFALIKLTTEMFFSFFMNNYMVDFISFFSLNIISTVVDGNDFTFSLSCVPHKIRSKVKSHFRLLN